MQVVEVDDLEPQRIGEIVALGGQIVAVIGDQPRDRAGGGVADKEKARSTPYSSTAPIRVNRSAPVGIEKNSRGRFSNMRSAYPHVEMAKRGSMERG